MAANLSQIQWRQEVSSTKLKPCPFCGGSDILPIEQEYGQGGDMDKVVCSAEKCGASTSGSFYGDDSIFISAIEKWNTRHGG